MAQLSQKQLLIICGIVSQEIKRRGGTVEVPCATVQILLHKQICWFFDPQKEHLSFSLKEVAQPETIACYPDVLGYRFNLALKYFIHSAPLGTLLVTSVPTPSSFYFSSTQAGDFIISSGEEEPQDTERLVVVSPEGHRVHNVGDRVLGRKN